MSVKGKRPETGWPKMGFVYHMKLINMQKS
jgi:hypothetical protein